MKPRFLIVGAMKAGTTTVVHGLNQHPDVFVASELKYFSTNFDKGPDWYEKHFKHAKILGEKSTNYMFLPECVKRIHSYSPGMKLIFVLRNPVDRTYSNYWHALNEGFETLSFKEAIRKEKERIDENIYYGYMDRSRYVLQIKRFLKLFRRSQMHFVIIEDLHFDNIFQFLDVSSIPIKTKKKNVSRRPLQIDFQRFAHDLHSKTISSAISKINKAFGRTGYPPMKKEIRQKIFQEFADDNHELSKLINRDVTKIWKS